MNRQLNEIISQIRLLFIFMISNGKREINNTIYPVPKNDSANSKANEEHVQYGCLKRTWNFLKHLGFSPFIKEQ